MPWSNCFSFSFLFSTKSSSFMNYTQDVFLKVPGSKSIRRLRLFIQDICKGFLINMRRYRKYFEHWFLGDTKLLRINEKSFAIAWLEAWFVSVVSIWTDIRILYILKYWRCVFDLLDLCSGESDEFWQLTNVRGTHLWPLVWPIDHSERKWRKKPELEHSALEIEQLLARRYFRPQTNLSSILCSASIYGNFPKRWMANKTEKLVHFLHQGLWAPKKKQWNHFRFFLLFWQRTKPTFFFSLLSFHSVFHKKVAFQLKNYDNNKTDTNPDSSTKVKLKISHCAVLHGGSWSWFLRLLLQH